MPISLLRSINKIKIHLCTLMSRKKQNIVLVTCIYNGLSATKYGGRLNRDSFYRDSLSTIASSGVSIYCFVSKNDLNQIKSTNLYTLTNIVWVILEINDIPFSKDIQDIKIKFPEAFFGIEWKERCVEIMWGKFYMLRRILNENKNVDCIYWIDAGLAHAGIISPKYISDNSLISGRIHDLTNAFPSILFNRITEFVDDQILGIKTTVPHHPAIPEIYNNNPYKTMDGIVGGIFGGRRANVLTLCDFFDEKCIKILHNNQLYFEESILTGIYADRPELFKCFTFDSWYHEGWKDIHSPEQINFSQFFDLMLQNLKPRDLVNLIHYTLEKVESTHPNFHKEKAMKTDQNVFDITLHNMGLSGEAPFFLVIGAMDGVSFDEFNPFIKTYNWSGVFVEPIPEQFKRLKENLLALGCSPNSKYENSAIAEHDGTVKMLTINQQAIDTGKVNSCFGGMSSIYPPRNGLGSEGDAKTVELYGEMIEVNCITLNTLITRHNIKSLDIICIDAEGWDYKILRQLDFTTWRPKLVRCEYINLNEEEKKGLLEILEKNDYVYHISGMDIDAVAAEHWNKISDYSLPIAPAQSKNNMTDKSITLVTSVIQASIDPAISHPNDLFKKIKKLLTPLQSSIPVIIYSPIGPATLAIKERSPNSTYLISKSINEFRDQDLYNKLLQNFKIDLKSESSKIDPQNIADSSFTDLSKMFLLNDATLFNPFNTELFLWVDIEILPEIVSSLENKNKTISKKLKEISDDMRFFLPSRALNKSDIEDLNIASQIWLGQGQSNHNHQHKATGHMFGGHKQAINNFNAVYYSCLNLLLDNKIKCTASTVLTFSSYSHHYLCNIYKKITIKDQILCKCKRFLRTKEKANAI